MIIINVFKAFFHMSDGHKTQGRIQIRGCRGDFVRGFCI